VEREAAEQRAKFYEEVKEGSIIEGEVSSLTDFGVFVNIGAVDGLVHMSEISWKRNVRIKDAFKKGDKVTVKVIGIDHENNRISLSIKQVDGDPWNSVLERIQKGMVLTGPVTNVTDFGAFVEIEPGVEGLVHIGDISWARIRHPKEAFRKGQEVQVQVLEIDTDKRRISLGFKQLHDPWRDIGERYKKGQDITVKVVRLADFGAFVEIEEGVEGLIHISQLSTKRVDKPGDVLREKQEVTARVIEVNPEQRRMRLSLSALEEQELKATREEENKRRHASRAEQEKHQKAAQEEVANYTMADLFKDQNISSNS
jgi:small subunit ribosomal protein S1